MIDINDVRQLANLARLSLTEEQLRTYQQDFSGILDYIAMINTVSVDKVDNALVLKNIVREDDEAYEPGQFSEQLLKQAPQTKDAFFKVPKIL